MKRKLLVGILLVVALALAAVLATRSREGGAADGQGGEPGVAQTEPGAHRSPAKMAPEAGASSEEGEEAADEEDDDEGGAEAADAAAAEEAAREAAEERAVDEFDAFTDAWREPTGKAVPLDTVEKFVQAFRKVPEARRDECIHRALNLIPDENVMLLCGVLMDPGMDREIVETVFNDVLNRDEEVKKPILQEIFRDKSHPCWADVAWILDVTGELPKPPAPAQAVK